MEKDNLKQESGIKTQEEQSLLERLWERAIWRFKEPVEMLYFAISVFALSLGVYFIKKHN